MDSNMLKPTTNHFIWHISDLIWACQVIQDNIKRAFEYVDLHLGPRSKSWSLVAAAQETTGYCWPRWRCWSSQVLSFLCEPWSKVGLCGMVINPLSWVLHTYYIQGFPCILTRLHLWRYWLLIPLHWSPAVSTRRPNSCVKALRSRCWTTLGAE